MQDSIMNTVKNCTTVHLQLNYLDVLEVVILLMTYLIKYVFQSHTMEKQKLFQLFL